MTITYKTFGNIAKVASKYKNEFWHKFDLEAQIRSQMHKDSAF